MARKPRKSNIQKLQDELSKVKENITKYEETLNVLEATANELESQIDAEKTRELIKLMEDYNVTINDLKDMLHNKKNMTATVEETQVSKETDTFNN